MATVECSSRWAGTITRRSDDMWERQKLNYIDELADKRAAVGAITERLAKTAGDKGGYGSKRERFAKQKRLRRCNAGWCGLKTGSARVGFKSCVVDAKR